MKSFLLKAGFGQAVVDRGIAAVRRRDRVEQPDRVPDVQARGRPLRQEVGDLAAAERYITMLIERSQRYGLGVWHMLGHCFLDLLLSRRGELGTGLPRLRAALGEMRSASYAPRYTSALGELAAFLGETEQAAEGLAAIDEALTRSGRNGQSWCAAELLRTAGELVTGGFAQARDLGRLTATPPAVTTTIQYPVRAGADEVPRAVTANVTTTRNQLRDMDDATDRDPRANVDPASLFDPIRYGLLRATSSAWRQGEPAPGNGANVFAADAGLRLSVLREKVQIEPPAGPYLLAASNAPLLITLDNPLAVQIDVQITLSEVPGLRTGSIDVVQVPAASRRQVRIPTEVIRAGQFSVEAQLSTPGGTPLGPTMPSRIRLRSTAYGAVTLALTGGGAVLLVLLAGYRITRRVRSAGKQGAAGDAS